MNNAWIQTFTGKQFWPLNPKTEDICIEDIAHALSMICRFNGHCSQFYSVAEHSVLVSRFCPDKFKLYGLLHDASEAYISDVGKPIKPKLNGYGEIEAQLQFTILMSFDQHGKRFNSITKDIDKRILVDEQKQLMPKHPVEWSQTKDIEPLGVELKCWQPEKAEEEFLNEFYRLKQ